MCGIPDIDVNDWKAHTTYGGACDSIVVEWFWDVVAAFSTEQWARLLLHITTGSSARVQGFKTLTMSDGRICWMAVAECRCPCAYTCFNQLGLPMYSTRNDVETTLTLVVQIDVTGFTIV
ncbi:Aste57867_19891 [Aphanomyces stellatus]|uniref:HECT-type E3 ubiquitin transferase n=1 Tax=Aphanomyces stellatus TaxID=120398 RepID=A0A485LED0_9STRA|nr:hypothetical protein As57867_019825 [Aphanomyces stellatus]VFT96589.1 Aste57867_19891 [Aphanomyces stellatus]